MFNDEVDILAFRVKYYRDIVTKFIISESNYGFNGKEKEALASEVLRGAGVPESQFEIVNYSPTEEMFVNLEKDRWPLERFARQSLYSEIAKLEGCDIVMLSDVDEIASREQILANVDNLFITSLVTPLYYRKANWLSVEGKNWQTFKIGPASHFDDLNEIRYQVTKTYAKYPGAHLSYLATTPNDIIQKSRNSAHKEFELSETEAFNLLSVCDSYAIDHLGRFNRLGFGLLKIVTRKKLNIVQSEFLKIYPEYFSFQKIKKGPLSRIFMSFKVTQWWESRTLNFETKSVPLLLLFSHRLLKQSIISHLKATRNSLFKIKNFR